MCSRFSGSEIPPLTIARDITKVLLFVEMPSDLIYVTQGENQYLHFIHVLIFSVKRNIFAPLVETCLQITSSGSKKDED